MQTTKVSIDRHPITVEPKLFELFPTLLSEGNQSMQQLTIKVDHANGQILKSAQPIIVSRLPNLYSLDVYCQVAKLLVDTMLSWACST